MLSRHEVEEEAHTSLESWMRDNREITDDYSEWPDIYTFLTCDAVDRYVDRYIRDHFDCIREEHTGIDIYHRKNPHD